MTSHEFAQKLRDCVPQENDLVAQGVDPDFAKEVYERSRCLPRNEGIPTNGALLDLVTNYDVSKVGVGGIKFVTVKQQEDKTIVAEVDGDPIYICNGSVYWAYHTDLDDIISICAESQEKFLDALVALGCYFTQTLLDEKLYEDEERTIEQATTCGKLAGGPDYRSFWADMIGCE